MLLILRHPQIAGINCQHCLKHIYDMDTGRPVKNDRTGEYRKRDDRCPPACQTDKGCPKGTPEKPNSLTPENEIAYQHYKECRAVGEFPDDPIVKRNAAIIREVEDSVDRERDYLGREEMKSVLLQVGMLKGLR